MFAETERVRQENAALASNLKTAVDQADQARAAAKQLERDLKAEQKARADAEKLAAQLRDQLRAVARAVSSAGLNVDKLAGTTDADRR